MSTIAALTSGESGSSSLTDINNNFTNLNADKQEKGSGVTNNIVKFGASNVLGDTGKTAPTGSIVGTTDTQALTNKDLSSGTNTFPSALATLTGTQALTNKDLSSGTNTFPAITEAMQTLADNTTNNVSTSKHGYAPKGDGDTAKFLNANGAYSTPSAAASVNMILSTDFSATGRYTDQTSSGTATFGVNGLTLDTTASATRTAGKDWQVLNGDQYAQSPTYSFSISDITAVGQGTDFTFFAVMGSPAFTGSGTTLTQKHIGIKITRVSSGTINITATQADGSTESTSNLTTMTAGDGSSFDFKIKVNGSSSVDYQWSKNQGAWTTANIAVAPPTGGTGVFRVGITNMGVATRTGFTIFGATYTR